MRLIRRGSQRQRQEAFRIDARPEIEKQFRKRTIGFTLGACNRRNAITERDLH
jgi:hypothetical protein